MSNFYEMSGRRPVVPNVGANVWKQVIILIDAAPNAPLCSFEPNNAALSLLKKNVVADSRVDSLNTAIDKTAGTVTPKATFRESGIASLAKRRLDHSAIDLNDSEGVLAVTLDSGNCEEQVFWGSVKMNFKSHEVDVLRGAIEISKTTNMVKCEPIGSSIISRTYLRDSLYSLRELEFGIFGFSAQCLMSLACHSKADESLTATHYLIQRTESWVPKVGIVTYHVHARHCDVSPYFHPESVLLYDSAVSTGNLGLGQ